MDFMKKYEAWINDSFFDEATRAELELLRGNHAEIEERFHKDLEFGTGGLRGIIGAGTNRVNIYTVRKATQGFANFLKKMHYEGELGILFAYDSRKFSEQFALEAALVMCANGIKAYVFESLRSTPQLSFGVRHLALAGGVIITASHNPPEYNGYKIYGADGAQVVFPDDKRIIEEVNKIDRWDKIKTINAEAALADEMLVYVGKEIDEAYYAAVLAQSIDKNSIAEYGSGMEIVFTPLHGTGNIPVRELLTRAGFNNIHVVKEQEEPDSNFSTVESPNPEDPKVFDLARGLAAEIQADIIIGTDPDADRIGVVARDSAGEYVFLNGNTIGVLLTEYILSGLEKKGQLSDDGVIISTIVSTNMMSKIANRYGVKHEQVLTGFKHVGAKIRQMDESGVGTYIFGFEESHGYLAGTYARDKDAICTAYLICEMAAAYKRRGMTLHDGLIEIYDKYGYYMEEVMSITLKGIDGSALMRNLMNSFRNEPLVVLGESEIVKIFDFNTGDIIDLTSGKVEKTSLPISNVLYYQTKDDDWMCIRPSGTEPKLKLYFGAHAESMDECRQKLKKITKEAAASFETRKNAYE